MSSPLKPNIKGMLVLALVLMWPLITRAEERRPITRSTFKVLCHESDGSRDKAEIPKTPLPDVYSIEEAIFHLTVSRENACGKMCLSGRILAGNPRRVPIIGDDIVITDILEVTGGSLICDFDTGPRIFLLPDESRAFRVTLSFMLTAQKDTRSRFISLGTAPALKNLLFLDHTADIRIEIPPGQVDRQGMVHVSSGRELVVRFNETTRL